MEEIKAGWYLIKHDGELYPARFDGKHWHKKHSGEHEVVEQLVVRCPTGCTCTNNPDGTVTITCS
ncbi:MAG TPA: hypothetical protein VL443_29895 [Cyclobacteriaceae bacterium]|jgi:hypothetical protein|nr:hypothetical protein [Cyclobacteriaceae bacterium]